MLSTKRKRCGKSPATYSSSSSSAKRRKDGSPLEVVAARRGVVGRRKEIKEIWKFVEERTESFQASSLYLCGRPGTGKTACVSVVLDRLTEHRPDLVQVFVNGNIFEKPELIFGHLLRELKIVATKSRRSAKDVLAEVFMPRQQQQKSKKGNMFVVVVDEIDQLLCNQQGKKTRESVLYQLFQWASAPNSQLILIGIANAIDLHDRFLPDLEKMGYKLPMLVFSPYNQVELKEILQARVSSEGYQFEDIALELCARKIAASSGDLRKGIDVCRQAVLLAGENDTQVVTKAHLLKVMRGIFGSKYVNLIEELPRLCQYVLCAVVRYRKKNPKGKMTVAELHRTYLSMAKLWNLQAPHLNQFINTLLERMQQDGLIELVGTASTINKKSVRLNFQLDDINQALRENMAMGRLLDGSIPQRKAVNMYSSST